MIRIIQGNMNRSKTADQLLHQLAIEKRAELLILSEQYNNKKSAHWYSDLLGTAAIWIPNGGVYVKTHKAGRGFVLVKSAETTYISCYFTPNESIADFRAKLDALEDEIHGVTGQMVVAGDFNARALEWGMPNPDTRGRLIVEMAARAGLIILNSGATTTFRRPGYTETIPDISLASEGLVPYIQGWRVMEDYCGSDHQYILFEVGCRSRNNPQDKPCRWNLQRLDFERFKAELAKGEQQVVRRMVTDGLPATEAMVSFTMDLINSACEASMPKIKPRQGKPSAYWWTPEIAEERKKCLALRRRAQRATTRAEANSISAEHKYAKKQLRRTINQSKTRCWNTLIEDIDGDPWGLGYKIVTKKLGAQKPICMMDDSITETIVSSLFPSHPERSVSYFGHNIEVPLFSVVELERTILSMKNNKAPGPDGIPSEILKIVFQQAPNLLLGMYNTCLLEGLFSSRWKSARLVLISKGKGDPCLPSSYRPLCMLDTAGKVFEKLIRTRLTAAIQSAGDLSPRQYGFRAGLSTIDAIKEVTEAVRRAEDHNHFSRRIVLLVTLDVKNAFNSVKWGDLLDALEHQFRIPPYLLRILNEYLKNRTLIYETNEGQRRIAVTAGVAQGSILGPDLWNAFYDSLLRIEMPDETRLVGYADDVAVLVAARDTKQGQLKLNQVMRKINSWMEEHGLTLALQKTEIAILTKKRIQPTIPMWIGEEVIETKQAVKYLGITIDSKLSFFEHIRKSADKAAAGITALCRLMANTSGPKSSKRRLLMSSTNSVLLYGAEIWAQSLDKEMYRKRLTQVQRRGALRVASAYRTVSDSAILVIAGCIPIHLLAKERKSIFLRKAEAGRKKARLEERARTIESWQTTWERDTKGRWTAKLIQQVSPWIERRHGEVGYYITQLLSGHGYFRQYLHRMGKVSSPECLYCPGVSDDVQHTFFACGNWTQRTSELEGKVGLWTPENVMEIMLRGEDSWKHVVAYVEVVLRTKKVDLDRTM